MLPVEDTLVTYPSGAVETAATVAHVRDLTDGRRAVLLDVTSVHPVDAGWPDQGADRAVLRSGTDEIIVLDCVVGATDGADLYLGRDIPVGKGTEGWAFVVVHIVVGDCALAEGDSVATSVDVGFRARTSAGHTACHLASLALNLAVADRWKKEPRSDALGTPDFDGTAIDVSLITENTSTDTYRLGKSLRKKGFVTGGLEEALPTIERFINATLATWVATDAAVHIDRDGDRLTDRRYWALDLPGQTLRIPCGGTHVSALSELGSLRVILSMQDVEGTNVLTMVTRVG
ncbi:metal-dependent hydrolase [Cryobacterium psychrophilum]|uniref:Metal-dependent hydrolase n=1 Tax=Cryobacterium psychrophilum TaxID=41988 RepID=A0A4Y8KQQ7_9MICO|nr:metal-dependent hydrolase [Cryobacterium psychrophilum]TDW29389.1 alanyl-tRNA synthetase [Cryobacterium psychrophilum]TFD81465.1 metal-dependent hydrolase [Cryobacterium psychrophilum]